LEDGAASVRGGAGDDDVAAGDVRRAAGDGGLARLPLDAVEYRPPAFADEGWPTYKVMDRTTERVTWLVRLNGEWVKL